MKYIYIIFLAFSFQILLSQNIKFSSTCDRKKVYLGEVFEIKYYLICDIDYYNIYEDIKYPDHIGFDLVGQNNSQNYIYIKNKKYIQDCLSVYFIAKKRGYYTIGPATIILNGKMYKTNSIHLHVLNNSSNNFYNSKNTFIKAIVSSNSLFFNQNMILKIKLYSKDLNIFNKIKNINIPVMDDVILTKISNNNNYLKQEYINRNLLFSKEIVTYNLSPKRIGMIKILPFKLIISLDDKLGLDYILKSNYNYINVKSIPTYEDKVYNGPIGNFNISTVVDTNQLNEDNILKYTVIISGKGNFNKIKIPDFSIKDDIQRYKFRQVDNYKLEDKVYKGSISQTSMLLLNNNTYFYTLPSISFKYFDPVKKSHITLMTDSIRVQLSYKKHNIINTFFKKHHDNKYLILSKKNIIIFIISIILCVLICIYIKNNIIGNKKCELKKYFKYKLKLLHNNISDQKEFFKIQELILRELFLKLKNIDSVSFSINLLEKQNNSQYYNDYIKELRELIKNCIKFNYSLKKYNYSEIDMKNLYVRTKNIVYKIINKF